MEFFFTWHAGQLYLFKDGGIALSEDNPTWVRRQETFQTEVPELLPKIYRRPQRSQKIYVKNRFLSIEQLSQI